MTASAPAAAGTAAACPLCGSTAAAPVERIPYAAVWEALSTVWGARFSEGVVRRHSPARDAVLVECGGCGLRHFAGAVAGDAEFYAELSGSSDYYVPGKWEFGVVRDRLAAGRDVLDVGCGDGDFLRVVAGTAARAVGIDTNPDAVARGAARGLDVRLAELDAFAAAHPAEFDLVCSFHVLEHLPSVRGFVASMLACLRPGGSLVVSVPNRLRARPAPGLEPLDCPPHHMSRWHPRQFAEMASSFGLELVRVDAQPADMWECRSAVRLRAERLLRPVAGGRAAHAVG
ncbi:MAG: Methyltransferase type 12, partial [Gemmatimonadetes bacterium]|nr:Methyltransferase type 12 [Gemmatimonadota bacterium]